MYTENKTERVEKYMKLAKEGFWARGPMHRRVMYIKEENNNFTAYVFDIIRGEDVNKSEGIKKYTITDKPEVLSCSMITCKAGDVFIKENDNYEKDQYWEVDSSEVNISVPLTAWKYIDFSEVPEDIKSDMECETSTLPRIGIGRIPNIKI